VTVKAPIAQTATTAISDRVISLKAALLALPECFIPLQVRVYRTWVKGKVGWLSNANCAKTFVTREGF
jgi:hypothetical protein